MEGGGGRWLVAVMMRERGWSGGWDFLAVIIVDVFCWWMHLPQ
jgi:hypothetical protein